MNFDYRSIPDIRVVPSSIKKYKVVFDKLDSRFILDRLRKMVMKQQSIINNTCINPKGVNVDEMQEIYKYIIRTIGENAYINVLEDNTENYSLFRSKTSIVSTYMFLVLYGIYLNNKKIIYYSYLSYGIFIYSKLFVKFIEYCSPSTFEDAIKITHGLSVFVKVFKKSSHIGVLNLFVSTEINKLITAINHGKYNEVVFSRSFSYIKTKINQSLRSFAQYYHKVANQKKNETDDEAISSSQISVILNQIFSANKQITNIPLQYIPVLTKDLNIDNNLAQEFIQTYIHLIHTDKDFEQKVKDMYTDIFRLFINHLTKVCEVVFITALYKITTLKNGSLELVELKRKIDIVLHYVVAHSKNKDKLSTLLDKTNIAKTRKLFIRFIYFIYIKPALCS